MALNLEQSSGLTAQFGNALFANSGAANTNVQTTNATTYAISGVVYSGAIKAAAGSVATDYRTGAAPAAILGAQAAMVVTGFDASGNLQFVQGPVVSFPAGSVAGAVLIPAPSIPNGFCPIAYQVVKNKNTAGTAGFVYGTGLFNAANVAFETAIQIAQMPNFGVVNAAA